MTNTERETDYGVPLPGEWVAEEARTSTHVQRLPLGYITSQAVFQRAAPFVVDLGCGNGRASILHALAHPEMDHLAVDIFPGAIRHASRRANRRGLNNIRFAVGDAREIIRRLPDGSVAEVHLYHPQPIYDMAAASKRLLTPAFLLQVHRVLLPTSRPAEAGTPTFILQTDHPAYWQYLETVVPLFFTWEPSTEPWPDAPEGRTRREILARQMGLPIFRAIAHPRVDLNGEDAKRIAEKMPLPRFDADRTLQQLDARENELGE
jgi:tRNA (guanine-N7-)-methyltransferase